MNTYNIYNEFQGRNQKIGRKIKRKYFTFERKNKKYEEEFEKDIALILQIQNLGLESYEEYIYIGIRQIIYHQNIQ